MPSAMFSHSALWLKKRIERAPKIRNTNPVRIIASGRFCRIIVSPFECSVSQPKPGHECELDRDERDPQCEQVPVPDVIGIVPVEKENIRQNADGDSGGARRLAAVRQEAFVDRLGQNAHRPFSSVNMSSVAHLNT